jgi:hypothetical protein
MSKNLREQIRQSATDQKPASLKRAAPKPVDLTKDHLAERDERWGVTVAYRLKPATKKAVARAAAEHNVEIGGLADFLLRASLTLLSKGHIELPVQEERGKAPRKLDLPPVPRDYT